MVMNLQTMSRWKGAWFNADEAADVEGGRRMTRMKKRK